MRKRGWWAILVGHGYAHNAEPGFSLIEILVALGILAAVAVVFLLGMSTSSKAVMVSQESVAFDSLAKSQMEFIKSQPYDDNLDHNPPQYLMLPADQIPAGYVIEIAAVRLNPDGPGDPTDDDDFLQQITVTITGNGQTTYTLVDYKVKR